MDAGRISEAGREERSESRALTARKTIPMSEDYAELMTTFPLLDGFTANGTKRLLAAGEITELAAGEVLLKEGETAEFAVLILKGTIEVFVEREGKQLALTEATAGDILGELALLCGIPRSASARAKENSTVLKWSDESLHTLLLRDRSLAQRIFRETLRTLVDKERELVDSLVKARAAS